MQTVIVFQWGLRPHLFVGGFTDDWCRRYIGLRITKSLAYANATGFDYDNPDINLLAAILTPYGKWRNATRRDLFDDGPFTASQMQGITRALLDQVHRVTGHPRPTRSEEHTSELQSLMRISYAVFCLKKKTKTPTTTYTYDQ